MTTTHTTTHTQDHDALARELIALAAARFERDAAAIAPEHDVFEALGVDSLQALDLLTELEERFDAEIPDHELAEVSSFLELARVVARRR